MQWFHFGGAGYMENRNIIVMGASAGGVEALKNIVVNLPADLAAAIFIVWHIAPEAQGILPEILNQLKTLPAAHAIDKEPIRMGRIYVAPPDQHLLLEPEQVRLTRGPRENRFRPAVDPLFRSAAFAYGPRVTGVVLSGGLDDGTAGLWTIKQWGGTAIVQDPGDAQVSSMPQSAIRSVAVDFVAPAAAIAPLLVQLAATPAAATGKPGMTENEKTKREVHIARGDDPLKNNIMDLGIFSPYTCPECHGVLSALKEGDILRFRCHTGHAFSAGSLLSTITEQTEQNLWNTIRSIQENVFLLNHLGDHLAELNQPQLAAAYFKKAKEAAAQAKLLSQFITSPDNNLLESKPEEIPKATGAKS